MCKTVVCMYVALKRQVYAEQALERKNMGKMPPLGPKTICHK